MDRRVFDLIEAGHTVGDVAAMVGPTEQTIDNWWNRHLVDAGRKAGTATVESSELVAAGKRIFECHYRHPSQGSPHVEVLEQLQRWRNPFDRTRTLTLNTLPTSTRRPSNVVDMRAGLAIMVAVALAAGCSGDAGDATSPINGAEDSSTADPTSQVPDSEPAFAPSETDPVESDELGGGDDGGRERITFDGVTFEYDPAVIGGIVPSRESADVDASSADASVPADVLFQFRVGDLETSSLTVIALSDRLGDDYPEVTPERLVAALDVESKIDADNAVSFVNGSGIRQIDDDGAYRFVGLTDDRRFLIDVEFDAETGVDEAVLDDVVRSLFVDVGADALNLAACVDDAFFVSDRTVPQGAEIEPGEEFVKVWRFRNTGTCVWNEQYSLAFGGGKPMTVLDTAAIEITEPGEELDLNVRLMAPDEPGAYGAQWQLVGPTGLERVGPPAVLFINVPDIADG